MLNASQKYLKFDFDLYPQINLWAINKHLFYGLIAQRFIAGRWIASTFFSPLRDKGGREINDNCQNNIYLCKCKKYSLTLKK